MHQVRRYCGRNGIGRSYNINRNNRIDIYIYISLNGIYFITYILSYLPGWFLWPNVVGVTAIDPGGDFSTIELEVAERVKRLPCADEPCITGIPCGDD